MMRPVVLLSLISVAQGKILPINTDEDFESTVMNDASVWVILFTSQSRESETQSLLEKVTRADQMMGGEVKFGVADVDYVKAVASEFNVRKRMLPRVLVFPTRARQAEILRDSDFTVVAVAKLLTENTKVDGVYQKLTLAIGGADEL